MTGWLAISKVRIDGHPVPYFTRIGWRGVTNRAVYGAPAIQDVRSTAASLQVQLDSRHRPALGLLAPRDVPTNLPVLVGRSARPDVKARRGAIFVVSGPTGQRFPLREVGTTESTPSLGPAGMLADYSVYSRDDPALENVTNVRILARAGTPETILTRLAAHGVSAPTTLQTVEKTLSQEPYALALNLYLVVTVLVLLLALAGLCVNLGVQLPGRRRDAASLRVVGVPRTSIFLAAAGEYVVLLANAAAAGVFAGTVAQSVVVRELTLGYADANSTPMVISTLDLGVVVELVVVAVVVLLVVAGVLAALTIRAARTATLREGAG